MLIKKEVIDYTIEKRNQLVSYGRFLKSVNVCNPSKKPDCPKTNCLFAGTGDKECWAIYRKN